MDRAASSALSPLLCAWCRLWVRGACWLVVFVGLRVGGDTSVVCVVVLVGVPCAPERMRKNVIYILLHFFGILDAEVKDE